jgi:DNA replication protein DnaC
LTGDMDTNRIKAAWEYFNPPRRLSGASFENYVPRSKQQQAALESCSSYDLDKIRSGLGLYLFGKYGTGKTHLAIAIVRALMEANPNEFGARYDDTSSLYNPERQEYQGLYCSFFPVVDLLDMWRPGSEAKQRRGEWLFRRAKADDLVILDDIGAEKASEWTGDRLYAVVDARYRNQKATIFTTNCSEKELVDNGYGRIISRIFEMTEQVPVIGPDHRRKMA